MREEGSRWGSAQVKRYCHECPIYKEPSRWIAFLVKLANMQAGGYPIQANDLSIEEWQQLGFVKSHMEDLYMKHPPKDKKPSTGKEDSDGSEWTD